MFFFDRFDQLIDLGIDQGIDRFLTVKKSMGKT